MTNVSVSVHIILSYNKGRVMSWAEAVEAVEAAVEEDSVAAVLPVDFPEEDDHQAAALADHQVEVPLHERQEIITILPEPTYMAVVHIMVDRGGQDAAEALP